MSESTHKLNADQTVAVATDVFWNEDMSQAPGGAHCRSVANLLQANVPDVILQPLYLLAGGFNPGS